MSTGRATSTATRALGVALLAYAASSHAQLVAIRLLLGVAAVMLLVFPERRGGATLATVGLLVAMGLAFDLLPNHHFVLAAAYGGLALNLGEGAEAANARARMAALLLAAVMALALIQKLLSPSYLRGDYFAYLFATGGLGGPLETLGWVPQWSQAWADNAVKVAEFAAADSPASTVELIAPFAGTHVAARTLAVFVLFAEWWLACVFARAHRHRVAGWSLAVFVLGLMLLREEYVFASTLCALGAVAQSGCERAAPRRALMALGITSAALAVIA